ncbi:MAG TPA: hypothetical protein VK348_11990 [Planctomycetota bacterium]|nr:hypothetical protein [Planctomycetota bacterium]
MMPLRVPTAVLVLLLGGCSRCDGGSGQPAPPPPNHDDQLPPDGERLLGFDGIDVTIGEVRPFVEFWRRIYPHWSLRATICKVLDSYLLPLRLAQREFPQQRAEQLQRATSLHAVASNSAELAAQCKLQGELLTAYHSDVTVNKVETPVALFLFDRSRLGATSEPIELPQGYLIAAAVKLHEGGVVGDDYIEALQVVFYTHQKRPFQQWLQDAKTKVAGKVTFVHPDFRTAVPEWLKLP